MAWYLSQTKSRVKPLIETITALPIVLPPSVIGFYMLIILSQDGLSNLKLLFSFEGLVVASIFYSLPFMVQPIQSGFETLDEQLLRRVIYLERGGW